MAEGLVIAVADDIVRAVRFPPGEVKREMLRELALALYQRGALSLGKARKLAGMTRWEFEELLGERRVVRHYSEADLQEDTRYGLGDQ